MDPRTGQIVEFESALEARERGLVPLPNRRARRAMEHMSNRERVAFVAGLSVNDAEAKLRDSKELGVRALVHLLRTSGVAWCGAAVESRRVNGMPVMDNAVNSGARMNCAACKRAHSRNGRKAARRAIRAQGGQA